MYSYFSFIFLIFTTVFFLAHCDGNFTEVSDADGTCLSNQIMRKVWKSIACKPRDTLVPLNPKPGQMFYPPVVSVSRCAGYTGDHACVPTNATSIQIKRIPVKVSINGLKPECRVVNVEEHIHCSHTCMIKETDCKTGQNYNQHRCKCECKHPEQKDKCNQLNKKMWNEENCQCVCQKEEECTTGLTWNKEFCKCL